MVSTVNLQIIFLLLLKKLYVYCSVLPYRVVVHQTVVGRDASWKAVEMHFVQIPGGNTAASAGVQSWYHTAKTQHEYILWGMKAAQGLDAPVSLSQSVSTKLT